jgi:osmotically-inducible protein OsmY
VYQVKQGGLTMITVKRTLGTLGLICALQATQALAQEQDWEGEAHDAWIDGKLEAAYLFNSELDNFKIGTSVTDGQVTLTGYVPSETHKQMAEDIAKNLDGVTGVTNQLTIGEGDYGWGDKERAFRVKVSDATTTVRLKSAYAINKELNASDIDIDTKDGVVTLTGTVNSGAAKQLAEQIADDYDYVDTVNNQLQVVASAQ